MESCAQAGFQPQVKAFPKPPVNAMLARLLGAREVGFSPASFAFHSAQAEPGIVALEIVNPQILAEWSILWPARAQSAAIARLLDSARRVRHRQRLAAPAPRSSHRRNRLAHRDATLTTSGIPPKRRQEVTSVHTLQRQNARATVKAGQTPLPRRGLANRQIRDGRRRANWQPRRRSETTATSCVSSLDAGPSSKHSARRHVAQRTSWPASRSTARQPPGWRFRTTAQSRGRTVWRSSSTAVPPSCIERRTTTEKLVICLK